MNFATLSAGSGGAAPATPGQVTGLAASGATASTMTLSWTAPSSGGTPTAYTVNYQVTGAGSWTSATTSASASPFTVTGLSASTSYEFEVIATNSGGSGTASSTVTASTGAATAAPGAPTNLAASEATSSTMELTWSAPGSGGTVSGYSAYFKLHSGSTWSLATAGLAASATSYTVTGLASGTSYDFYVAANSAGSGSTSSSTVTASTTTIAGPNAVTALAAGTVTNFTVPLSWTAPAIDGSHGAAATYTIQYRINGSTNWATAASGIATAYYTVTGLIAGLEYQFNVFGVNAAGSGSGTTTTGTPGPALGTLTYWGTGGYPNAPVTHGTTGAIANFTVSSSVASASFGWSATQVDPPATLQVMTLYNGNPLVYGSYSANMPASAGTWYGWMIFYDSGGDAVFAVIATTGPDDAERHGDHAGRHRDMSVFQSKPGASQGLGAGQILLAAPLAGTVSPPPPPPVTSATPGSITGLSGWWDAGAAANMVNAGRRAAGKPVRRLGGRPDGPVGVEPCDGAQPARAGRAAHQRPVGRGRPPDRDASRRRAGAAARSARRLRGERAVDGVGQLVDPVSGLDPPELAHRHQLQRRSGRAADHRLDGGAGAGQRRRRAPGAVPWRVADRAVGHDGAPAHAQRHPALHRRDRS